VANADEVAKSVPSAHILVVEHGGHGTPVQPPTIAA